MAGLALAFAAVAGTVGIAGPEVGSPLRHAYALPVVLAALGFGPVGGGLAGLGAAMVEAPVLLPAVERDGPAVVLEDAVTVATLLLAGPLVGTLAAEARRLRLRNRLLLAAHRALAEPGSLPAAVDAVAACLARHLGGAQVALVAADGERLTVSGGAAVADASAVRAVLASGQSVFVPDAGGGPRPRRAFVAPLLAHGRVMGALAVERVGELPRREREWLAGLGLALGPALENVRLATLQRRFGEELARQVAAATRRLEEADRAKSALVAVASHELRTPLTALLGFAELLVQRRFSPGEVRRLARILHRETERLVRIVDDLLDLSRLERGHQPRVRRAPVAVAPALAAAVEVFAGEQATHPIRLDLEEALPPVLADRDALDRIVKNLVANAVKYSPRGRPITLRARRRPQVAGVEITVEDEGRGIPAEALPHLFEPYYRAPEVARTVPGAGLGLAVVKALVDAHGGAIRVDSAPGRGTRIVLTLPGVS